MAQSRFHTFFLFQMCPVRLLPSYPGELVPWSAVRGAITVLSGLVLVFFLVPVPRPDTQGGLRLGRVLTKHCLSASGFYQVTQADTVDDGGFGKLTHSILSNRCIGESWECAWEGFCVGKAGKPAIDLTCTRWRTHTEPFSGRQWSWTRTYFDLLSHSWVSFKWRVGEKNRLLSHGLIQSSPNSYKYQCPI